MHRQWNQLDVKGDGISDVHYIRSTGATLHKRDGPSDLRRCVKSNTSVPDTSQTCSFTLGVVILVILVELVVLYFGIPVICFDKQSKTN